LRGIYTGELLKIAFTIALFVIAIRLLDVMFLLVVASYLAMVAVNWLALLFIDVGEAPQSPTPGAGSSL
jgi:F0F1-type ATP synthase assembly protein I